MMTILGVSPLRGFPVERRGIGHIVPILCGRRLAGLVRLGGGVCPSASCPVGTIYTRDRFHVAYLVAKKPSIAL